MKEPRWLTPEIVIVLQSMLLAEHGGDPGIRDMNGLESALGRPLHKFHYESPELPELAAAYAYGLSSNHPFLDGNKRVALAALDVFLRLNGWALATTEVDAAATMIDLASGRLSEADLAAWVRKHAERI